MGAKFEWTAERIEQLLQLKREGQPFSQICLALGCSRNAAIGKHTRLRIAAGHKATPRKRVFNILPEVRRMPPRPDTVEKIFGRQPKLPTLPATGIGVILPAITKPVQRAPQGRECGITEVTGCRWPVGHDASVAGGHLFCNEDQADGSPYCPCHRQESTAPYSHRLIKKTIRQAIFSVKMKRAA